MASNFPGSVDVFKTIPTPTLTRTDASDVSNDTLSTRLQQHSDAVIAVENWLINKSYTSDIWSVRLRSFNSVGNPSFSVIQRNAGSLLTNPANLSALEDRWFVNTVGTMTCTVQDTSAPFPGITIPGTSFSITHRFLRVTITGQEAVLGSADRFVIFQTVEAAFFRELAADVHSISLLVRSSVAGLTFGVNLQDPSSSTSLSKLCTIPTAGVVTLIQLPNLPVFSTGGSFSIIPGNAGYFLNITLAAGTGSMPAGNDTWVNQGDRVGAVGQSNFFANPINSTFDIAFVQHEPGPNASQLIDKPFVQSLEESQRYFGKSYDYGTQPGAINNSNGVFDFVKSTNAGQPNNFVGALRFPKTMARVPTVKIWNFSTGGVNSVNTNGGNLTVTGVSGAGTGGFDEFTVTSIGTATEAYAHYTADSGW